MRFFQHLSSGALFVSSADALIWHLIRPDQTRTRQRTLHLWTRTPAAGPGATHDDYSLQAVSAQQMEEELREISFAQAFARAPYLLDYVERVSRFPQLPFLWHHLPRGSTLHLLSCARSATEHYFEIYRQGEDSHLLYLNPLLEPLLPWQEIAGARLLAVPGLGSLALSSQMLVLALERRLWGIHQGPAYRYAYGYELEESTGR